MRKVADLPYISRLLGDTAAASRGIGGQIKVQPADFVVEEIPLYEPSGAGEHLYLRIEREGWNTRDIVTALARTLNVRPGDIGVAGLKDRQARATQWFSVHTRDADPDAAASEVAAALGVRVLEGRRHGNKLRRGHLIGNRFAVLVRNPEAGADETASAVLEVLKRHGAANFYGTQRFGNRGDNADRGRALVRREVPRSSVPRWQRELYLSAYQAHLFNRWLVARLDQGTFDELLEGDLAKKTDTGGIFLVEDLEAETPRFASRLITYTGPIYGGSMRAPQGRAKALEDAILEAEGVSTDEMGRAKLVGSRRPAQILLDDFEIESADSGLRFRFSLLKGQYATTVLREFMKLEVEESG